MLDIIEEFVFRLESELITEPALMSKLVGLFVLLLQKVQSHYFIHQLFAALRSFVPKFRKVLYVGSNSYIGDICQEVLRYCNSPTAEIRAEAVAFMYLLMKVCKLSTFNCT